MWFLPHEPKIQMKTNTIINIRKSPTGQPLMTSFIIFFQAKPVTLFRDNKFLSQDHTDSEWWRQGLKLGSVKHVFLPTPSGKNTGAYQAIHRHYNSFQFSLRFYFQLEILRGWPWLCLVIQAHTRGNCQVSFLLTFYVALLNIWERCKKKYCCEVLDAKMQSCVSPRLI